MNEKYLNPMDEFEKQWAQYQQTHSIFPNIMILGRTGIGKSSLINRIFGKDVAAVSDIQPETQEFDCYYGNDYGIKINFIDSKGYEINDDADDAENSKKAFIQKVKNEIINRYNKEDSKIHIVWYGISVAEARVEPIDIELIRVLSNMPETKNRLAVVLTKCDEDDEQGSGAAKMKDVIKKRVGSSSPIFEVSTKLDCPLLDLNKITSWSIDSLDSQDLRDNFISSQRVSLDEKKRRAKIYINVAVTAATAAGAIPIPFSDSAVLTPIQMTMIVGIINTYDMQSLANISKQLVSDIVISSIGKSVAGGLLKLIPAAGQLIGGAINATVAASITKALGEACSYICYNACIDMMNGKRVDFENLFNFELIMDLVKKSISAKGE